MPQAILKPSRAGDLSDWTPHGGAATIWEALSDGGPSKFASGIGAGSKFLVGCESLPGTAATVGAVALFVTLSGDDLARFSLALRLAGVDAFGLAPVVPPDSGYNLFSVSWPLAPDGGAWTVAKVNAIQLGVDQLDNSTTNALAGEAFLAVDWEPAVPVADPPGFPAAVRFPDTLRRVDFPSRNPVDIRMPVLIERRVTWRRD